MIPDKNSEQSATDFYSSWLHWRTDESKETEKNISLYRGHTYVAKRMKQLQSFEEPFAPKMRAAKLFFIRRAAVTQKASLWCCDSNGLAERMLLGDAAEPFSTYSVLGECHPSDDAEMVALSLRSPIGGTERTIRVFTIESGALIQDVVQAGSASVVWAPDGSGFYYVYDPHYIGSSAVFPKLEEPAVCFHRLGDPQQSDDIIFAKPEYYQYALDRLENGRFLSIRFARIGAKNSCGLSLKDLSQPHCVAKQFIREFFGNWEIIGEAGTRIYALTTNEAQRGRIVSIDVDSPARRVTPTVPACAPIMSMTCAVLLRDWILVVYSVEGFAVLRRHHTNGKPAGDIPLPGFGCILELVAVANTNEAIILFESYGTPPILLRANAATESVDVLLRPAFDLKLPEIAVDHIEKSKASVGITLVRGKDTKGPAPTLICMKISSKHPSPVYDAPKALWLAQGGQIAFVAPRPSFEPLKSWSTMHSKTKRRRMKMAFVDAVNYMRRQSLASSVIAQCDPGHWSILAEVACTGGALLNAVLLGQGIGGLSTKSVTRASGPATARNSQTPSEVEDDIYAKEPQSPEEAERLKHHPATLFTMADHVAFAPASVVRYINALRSDWAPLAPKLFQYDERGPWDMSEAIQRQVTIFAFAAWYCDLSLPSSRNAAA